MRASARNESKKPLWFILERIDMNIGLEDTMPLGKYKSRKIKDIYRDDAEYLVWFRQARKDSNQDAKFFNPEVGALLDMTIEASPQLQRKFKAWGASVDVAQANSLLTHVDIFDPSLDPARASAVEYKTWGQF